MERYFVPFEPDVKEIWINGAEAHHMLDVKRLRINDKVLLFNGIGYECSGYIDAIYQERGSYQKRIKIHVEDIKIVDTELNVSITMAFSPPKGKRSDLIIQKSSELGVKKIIPLISERSIVRLPSTESQKIEKWRRISIEASKQCGRNLITEICKAMTFDSLIQSVGAYNLAIIFSPEARIPGIKEILKDYREISNILYIIGPEGGFSDREIKEAEKAGCRIARLASPILRTETAAIAIAAILMYEYS